MKFLIHCVFVSQTSFHLFKNFIAHLIFSGFFQFSLWKMRVRIFWKMLIFTFTWTLPSNTCAPFAKSYSFGCSFNETLAHSIEFPCIFRVISVILDSSKFKPLESHEVFNRIHLRPLRRLVKLRVSFVATLFHPRPCDVCDKILWNAQMLINTLVANSLY